MSVLHEVYLEVMKEQDYLVDCAVLRQHLDEYLGGAWYRPIQRDDSIYSINRLNSLYLDYQLISRVA